MKNLKIRKIPLEFLLWQLTQLYNEGVNYVDIEGDLNDERDSMRVKVIPEYYDLSEGNKIDLDGNINDVCGLV